MRAIIGFSAGVTLGVAVAAIRFGVAWGNFGWPLAGVACGIVYLLITRPRKAK